MGDDGPDGAWAALVDGLRAAGEEVAARAAALDVDERADAYRALVRALANQLSRFEVDRERPELVAFNGWRHKMLMDNPDFRYWVADVRDDRRYRIEGNLGGAVYQSITAYARGGVGSTAASARVDGDDLAIDDDGSFSLTLSRERPETGDWLALPEGAAAVWVRHFHDDVRTDQLGWCRIDPLDDPPPPPVIDADRFAHHLRRTGRALAALPAILDGSTAADLAAPNQVRHWEEMAGGAAFTEPGIHYLRGSWSLEPDEALVLDGALPPCRYWNVLLYSRALNSLDHRHRTVSRTAASSRIVDGRYRFVLAASDPGPDVGDWLDTEGRRFGLVVLRFLQPDGTPELPTVERVRLSDLGAR